MGADGVRWPCLGTESAWATCQVPFTCVLPVFTLSTVSFGLPKRPPKRPETAPMALGHAPPGSGGPYRGAKSTQATV